MKLIRKITERIARRNPIEYARKIGVKVGNECRFTGNPRWGSEPWLIQVENHVLLSAEVNFVTHDAARSYSVIRRNIKMCLSLRQS